MTEETIAMTQKATDRLSVIQQVVNRQLRQREAAVQLGLSIRRYPLAAQNGLKAPLATLGAAS